MRMLIGALLVIGAIAGGSWWYWKSHAKPKVAYRTAEVQRGDLLSTINATGTVEPEEVVDVGAQVAGLIETFGQDADGKSIDYRSPVEPNMVLAHIDDATYRADFNTAKGQLDQAKASLQKGQADMLLANAKLYQAEQNWSRAQKIGPSDALSQSDYDQYKYDDESAKANVEVAAAEIATAQANIIQAQAGVDKAQRNLDFCTIRSPVKGEIIDRRVNIGQTVVSSLNAPSLFLIGKDLSKMQVWVAVNEADIDHIKPGQNVSFTCDAKEGRTFKGLVGKVRLNATMTQNVVTYTVEVNTDNSERELMPYWTANVEFEVKRDPGVLLVPNAALRWYPSDATEVVADARGQYKPVDRDEAKPAPPEGAKPSKADHGGNNNNKPRERKGTLWLREGEFVRPLQVKVGPSDGINTEILTDKIKGGDTIVVGEVFETEDAGGEHDPFLPQLHRNKH